MFTENTLRYTNCQMHGKQRWENLFLYLLPFEWFSMLSLGLGESCKDDFQCYESESTPLILTTSCKTGVCVCANNYTEIDNKCVLMKGKKMLKKINIIYRRTLIFFVFII